MNWMWGFMHTWTLILGIKIYYDYPWMINNNSFWKQACPSSGVTNAATGSATATSGEVYTLWATGWSNSKCLSVFPITNWTTESWLLMIVSAVGWLLWAFNVIFGNDGRTLHMIQLRWTEIYLIFPIVYIWLAQIISNGSKPAAIVQLSWTNSGGSTGGTNTTLLQWQQQAIPRNNGVTGGATVPDAQANWNYFSYDQNFNWYYNAMMITGALTAGFWAVSLRIFWNHYAEKNDDWNWEQDQANPDNARPAL